MTSGSGSPKISVIVPVYNVEQYLENCLKSIIGQTYKNIEIICVNDGSPDNSQAILEKYAEKDDRIIIINKQNGGLSSARNAGMIRATGDFIAFVDSDDYIAPQCYEIVIKNFAEGVDVVHYAYASMNNEIKQTIRLPIVGKHKFSEGMLTKQPWNVWTKVFRASELKKYNMIFREGILYEDLEFVSRYFLTARPIVMYIDESLYFYRVTTTSIMGQSSNKKEGLAIQHIYLLDSIYDYLREQGVLNKNLQDFLMVCQYCFKSACSMSPQHEQAKCYAEMTSRLRKYNLDYTDFSLLSSICHGEYNIYLPSKEEIKKLKRLERIFCIRNELNYKVVRMFGKVILQFKRN